MSRSLAFLIGGLSIVASSTCGDSPAKPRPLDLAGTLTGTATMSDVRGNSCIRRALAPQIGTSYPILAEVTQNGTQMVADITWGCCGATCRFNGGQGSHGIILHADVCSGSSFVGETEELSCGIGKVRTLESNHAGFAGGGANGFMIGDLVHAYASYDARGRLLESTSVIWRVELSR